MKCIAHIFLSLESSSHLCDRLVYSSGESDRTTSHISNEGLPNQFLSRRSDTVRRIVNSEEIVMFCRAPPWSGKTAMCTLLFEEFVRDESLSVVRLSCQFYNSGSSFADLFEKFVGCNWDDFLRSRQKRVLIVDEVQKTYLDAEFWDRVKAAMQMNGLRMILFAAYGSNDRFRISDRFGTPIAFSVSQVFGLENKAEGKPGLYLTRPEFAEMCHGSIVERIADIVWDLCGKHIGVAYNIICFFHNSIDKVDSEISLANLARAAYSLALVNSISTMHGVPTYDAVHYLCKQLGDDDRRCVITILDSLAGTFDGVAEISSSRTIDIIDSLVKSGILFEDEIYSNKYRFASSMHRKAWMISRYTSRMDTWTGGIVDFLIDVVARMRGKKLAQFACENNGSLRKNQIQQEFYHAISTAVPPNATIIPEWETFNDQNECSGYVDYNMVVDGKRWLYELLVNGDRANEHLQRFQDGGKYHGSLRSDDSYVLVDFRHQKNVLVQKAKTVYVVFCDGFRAFEVFREGIDNKRMIAFMDSKLNMQ